MFLAERAIIFGISLCIGLSFANPSAARSSGKSKDKEKPEQSALCAPADAAAEQKSTSSFSGNVSWYGPYFHGRPTASGEIFDMRKLTAAHKELPFYTKVLVENPKTGRSCVVKVNDRGPYVKGRVMDLSKEGMHRVAPLMPGIIYADCLILDEQK